MKSPICRVCGKDFRSEYFHTGKGGGYLIFADYTELPKNMAGHPSGLDWFCKQHLIDAKSLMHKNLKEAVKQIREKCLIIKSDLPTDYSNINDPELWITNVGDKKSKVFGIIRRAMNISPLEAKSLLSSGSFKVITGWPANLEYYRQELEDSGATIEIRYDT